MRDMTKPLPLAWTLSFFACHNPNGDNASAVADTDPTTNTTSTTGSGNSTTDLPTGGSSMGSSSGPPTSTSTSTSSTTGSITTEGSTTAAEAFCSDTKFEPPDGTSGSGTDSSGTDSSGAGSGTGDSGTDGSGTGETDTTGGSTGGGEEECDLGKELNKAKEYYSYGDENPENYTCTQGCKLARSCGDGQIDDDYGEECDGEPGCAIDCRFERRRVFVTSQVYCGDMGTFSNACNKDGGELLGVARGDARCQELAKAAGFPTWDKMKVWLSSDDTDQPKNRFNAAAKGKEFGGLYVMVDAQDVEILVAQGWTGLVDGMLDTPDMNGGINVDEYGAFVPEATVWTNVKTNGELTGADSDCMQWANSTTMATGGCGRTSAKDTQWTAFQALLCLSPSRLYCFEDP